MVHQLVVDIQLTLGNVLKTGDHAQRSGLAAAGRTDENDELLVFNLQVEVAHRDDITGINLVYAAKGQTGHMKVPPRILFLNDIIAESGKKVNGAISQKEGEALYHVVKGAKK